MGGPFSGTRTFAGLALKSVGPQDAYVVKLSPSGQLLKSLIVSSANPLGVENIFDLVVDKAGNTYINGQYSHELMLGSFKLTPRGPSDHFLAKLDTNLTVVWAKSFGGIGKDGGNEIALAEDSTLILSAMSDGYDFPGNTQNLAGTAQDGYLLKVSASDGAVLMVKQFGGPGDQQVRAIAADIKGNMIVGLEYNGTATFESTQVVAAPGSGSFRANKDGALFYLDASGKLIWHKQVSTANGLDNFRAAGFDSHGDIYASGVHATGARFIGGLVGAIPQVELSSVATDKSYDQFVVKYAQSGALQWYRRFARSAPMASQSGGELEVSEDDVVYISGGFRSRLSLADQNNQLVRDVFALDHTRDSNAVVALNADGSFREGLYYRGSVTSSDDSVGNSASAVLDSRKIGDQTYLAVGAVLEATGDLKIVVEQGESSFPTSTTTREFSAALFIK